MGGLYLKANLQNVNCIANIQKLILLKETSSVITFCNKVFILCRTRHFDKVGFEPVTVPFKTCHFSTILSLSKIFKWKISQNPVSHTCNSFQSLSQFTKKSYVSGQIFQGKPRHDTSSDCGWARWPPDK